MDPFQDEEDPTVWRYVPEPNPEYKDCPLTLSVACADNYFAWAGSMMNRSMAYTIMSNQPSLIVYDAKPRGKKLQVLMQVDEPQVQVRVTPTDQTMEDGTNFESMRDIQEVWDQWGRNIFDRSPEEEFSTVTLTLQLVRSENPLVAEGLRKLLDSPLPRSETTAWFTDEPVLQFQVDLKVRNPYYRRRVVRDFATEAERPAKRPRGENKAWSRCHSDQDPFTKEPLADLPPSQLVQVVTFTSTHTSTIFCMSSETLALAFARDNPPYQWVGGDPSDDTKVREIVRGQEVIRLSGGSPCPSHPLYLLPTEYTGALQMLPLEDWMPENLAENRTPPSDGPYVFLLIPLGRFRAGTAYGMSALHGAIEMFHMLWPVPPALHDFVVGAERSVNEIEQALARAGQPTMAELREETVGARVVASHADDPRITSSSKKDCTFAEEDREDYLRAQQQQAAGQPLNGCGARECGYFSDYADGSDCNVRCREHLRDMLNDLVVTCVNSQRAGTVSLVWKSGAETSVINIQNRSVTVGTKVTNQAWYRYINERVPTVGPIDEMMLHVSRNSNASLKTELDKVLRQMEWNYEPISYRPDLLSYELIRQRPRS